MQSQPTAGWQPRCGPRSTTVRSNVLLGISSLQVVRRETCVLGDSSEHLGANFFSVVECEDEIRISGAAESTVRSGPALELPPDGHQRRVDATRLRRRPGRHAAMLKVIAWGPVSEFSRRSARTRRARTCALAMASSAELPYARTPGSCGTSASHRPSSSRSHSISKFMATPILRRCVRDA